MSETAAPASTTPATAVTNPASAELLGKDTHNWDRSRSPKPEPAKEQPKERTAPVSSRKEVPTSEKPHTEKPKAAKPATEADDDPEFEIDGDDGAKIKIKRSALIESHKRAKEIERASHERFRTAAEARKSLEQEQAQLGNLWQQLEKDPWAIHRARLIRSGVSEADADTQIDALAEARLVAQMQRARMSPGEIELEQIKSRNAELEQGEKTRAEQEKQQRHAALTAKHREQWDRTIAEAMTSANLARTRATAARVARVLADHFDPATGKSIEPALAARIARDQHHGEIRHELGEIVKTNPRAAIDLIGPALVKEIRALLAQEHQEFVPQQRKPANPDPKPQPPRKLAPPTLEDARAKLGIKRY